MAHFRPNLGQPGLEERRAGEGKIELFFTVFNHNVKEDHLLAKLKRNGTKEEIKSESIYYIKVFQFALYPLKVLEKKSVIES